MKTKVLIAEDDPDLGHLLRQYLGLNGFEATRVFNGKEARKVLSGEHFDIAVLDVMMPEEDGLLLARELRHSYPGLPFLFVTAKNSRDDILAGLKLGADDYITKPFDADELILRINNIINRSNLTITAQQQERKYQIGCYLFRPQELCLMYGDNVQLLTEKEAQLLLYLYHHRNTLIRREQILKELWKENDFFKGRSMDVFITRLRKYLKADPDVSIESVRGVGYHFIISEK